MPFRIFDAGRIQQPFNTEIVQRIKSQVVSELIHRFAGRNQLAPGREIDAIMTGVPVRRTGNPHVHALHA